jgi:hypothetical protein
VRIADAQFPLVDVDVGVVDLDAAPAAEAVEAGLAELERAAHAEAVGIAVDVHVIGFDIGIAELVVRLRGERHRGDERQGKKGTLHLKSFFSSSDDAR